MSTMRGICKTERGWEVSRNGVTGTFRTRDLARAALGIEPQESAQYVYRGPLGTLVETLTHREMLERNRLLESIGRLLGHAGARWVPKS
jgi:hypothetical protein